jgi:hypothetical protein
VARTHFFDRLAQHCTTRTSVELVSNTQPHTTHDTHARTHARTHTQRTAGEVTLLLLRHLVWLGRERLWRNARHGRKLEVLRLLGRGRHRCDWRTSIGAEPLRLALGSLEDRHLGATRRRGGRSEFRLSGRSGRTTDWVVMVQLGIALPQLIPQLLRARKLRTQLGPVGSRCCCNATAKSKSL